jgi:single-strand DNA-binding protein
MNDPVGTLMRASVHRFIGRLGADPKVRFFESGSCVASANIAINKPGQRRDDGQQPDWVKVDVWGDGAQAFADTCRQGALVDVSGRVKTERWTDWNTGEEKMQLAVTAEQWELVPQRSQQQAAAAPPPAAASAPAQSAAAPGWNEEPPF